MNKHGHRHVRKINDGRPKPYLGRISFAGVEYQTRNCATALEASLAAQQLKLEKEAASTLPSSDGGGK